MSIVFVQQAQATTSGTNQTAVTISTPGATNFLVAWCQIASGVSSSNISGVSGGGVTWVKAIANNNRNSNCEIWYGFNSSGSGTTVTVTWGQTYGTDKRVHVAEFSGIVTSGSTDGTGSHDVSNPSTTNFYVSGTGNNTAVNITPTGGVDILIIANVVTGGTVSVDPASFTKLTTTTLGPCYYRIVTAPSGAYNAALTMSSVYFGAVGTLAIFDAAGGGAVANGNFFRFM